jgi:uncharacterized OB-fold protein
MEIRISGDLRVEIKKNSDTRQAYCSKCGKEMSEYLEFLNLGKVESNENNFSTAEFKENKEAFIIL